MATQEALFTVSESAPVEIPDEREYTSEEAAELDQSLIDAIDAAEAAGNDYLSQLLANELGSHYYDTR